ncbi:MAG: hypothetical protein HY833_01925 [Candidatus Aenigmarchaeota archaeon]|nr:hypothetical protein [Candidatus Aenigmarchaeota archaeon]
MAQTHIVKRKGRKERFDERKIYLSCFASCRVVGIPDKQNEKICGSVVKSVRAWVKNKREVRSKDIMKFVVSSLRKHDKDAAFMYETHKDIG